MTQISQDRRVTTAVRALAVNTLAIVLALIAVGSAWVTRKLVDATNKLIGEYAPDRREE